MDMESSLRAGLDARVDWIRKLLAKSNARGVILGLSGGKDSAIVAALCALAVEDPKQVVGVIMPCGNIDKDEKHAYLSAEGLGITVLKVPLAEVWAAHRQAIEDADEELSAMAAANMKPRLRMITLYAMGYGKNLLVAGTGNRSEIMTGYFTKWGDGGYDFNPIADLTATEVFALGRILKVPAEILDKAPSAGLWEGQTDEQEMGFTYAALDNYLQNGSGEREDVEKIEKAIARSGHKRTWPELYRAGES